MRILLINPVISLQSDRLDFPLNLIYLASGLHQLGKNIHAIPIDLNFELLAGKVPKGSVMRAQENCISAFWSANNGFDAIGISGLCDNFHLTIKIAEFVKEHFNVPVIVGGPHATFLAREILEKYSFIDFVVRHDGVYPLVKLCEAIRGNWDLDHVPALAYRAKDGLIAQTPLDKNMPSILDIAPDYSILSFKEYSRINPQIMVPILAGIGCPFECSYCSTSAMWHRQYKVLAPDTISQRVSALKSKFPNHTFSFVHDNLLVNRIFAEKLCEEMRKLEVIWRCSSRIEHINEKEFIRRLSDSGCKSIFIGIETGSMNMQRLLKKCINIDYVLPLELEMRKVGIRPTFSFIVGFPEETDTDRNATISFACKLKAANPNNAIMLQHLFPLPGTKYAKDKLTFYSQKRNLLAAELVDSSLLLGMIRHDQTMFSAFWRVADNPNNTPLLPAATFNINRYLSRYPRAFNYLFSKTGLLPVQTFELLASGSQKKLMEGLRVLLGSEYKAFAWLVKYERTLKKLSESEAPVPIEINSVSSFDVTRRYTLSKGAVLFRMPIPANELFPGYSHAPDMPQAASGTSLLIACAHKSSLAYYLKEDLYKVLSSLRTNSSKSCAEILVKHFHNHIPDQILSSLRTICESGALVELVS